MHPYAPTPLPSSAAVITADVAATSSAPPTPSTRFHSTSMPVSILKVYRLELAIIAGTTSLPGVVAAAREAAPAPVTEQPPALLHQYLVFPEATVGWAARLLGPSQRIRSLEVCLASGTGAPSEQCIRANLLRTWASTLLTISRLTA